MFSHFNHNCFLYFLKNDESMKLTEEKVKMALRKLTENVALSRASKDPVALAKQYHNSSTYSIYYFINFAFFLIKLNGFDTFLSFMQSVYSGDKKDIDDVFIQFYQLNTKEIFEKWKNS